jgi:chromosome segregation ATPase
MNNLDNNTTDSFDINNPNLAAEGEGIEGFDPNADSNAPSYETVLISFSVFSISESASVWLHSLDTDIENTEKEMRTVSYEGANEYVERTALSPSDLKIMNIRPDYRTELQARQSELRLQIEALQEDTHILNQEISVIERTIQDLKSERGKIEQESERGSEVSQKMLAGYDEVIAAWVNSANSEHQKLWKTVESLRQCAESLRSLELELSPLTAMRTV